MSFSDDLRYASETSNAGPGISDSTSRENVTEGRAVETGSNSFSASTYKSSIGGKMDCKRENGIVNDCTVYIGT